MANLCRFGKRALTFWAGLGQAQGVQFPTPLIPATLLQRYKRVLADVRLEDGAEALAHVPNTGAMLGVAAPGMRVWLEPAPPGRKTAFGLRLVEADGGLVGVDTSLPNKMAAEALAAGAIPELSGYSTHRPEVKYAAASRVDFLLEAPGRPPCYLEVKNVHLMRRQGLAEFPDCKAARSARHMHDLAAEVAAGARAVALFVVQRMDCNTFSPAADLDPAFAEAFTTARAAGVETLAYACDLSTQSVVIARRIAISGD